jgi:hypothetical protein
MTNYKPLKDLAITATCIYVALTPSPISNTDISNRLNEPTTITEENKAVKGQNIKDYFAELRNALYNKLDAIKPDDHLSFELVRKENGIATVRVYQKDVPKYEITLQSQTVQGPYASHTKSLVECGAGLEGHKLMTIAAGLGKMFPIEANNDSDKRYTSTVNPTYFASKIEKL